MPSPVAPSPAAQRDHPQVAALLAGLNAEQRAAAAAVTGPVCILAGAGTGKTRTITHRIAVQIASGTATPDQILAVTFTERAAHELRSRLDGLGAPAPVRALTFHAAAWAQLRYFWPRVHGGPLPEVLPSKLPLLGRTAARVRAEARDLASEIEWAKARGLTPATYAAAAAGRDLPVQTAVMAEIFADYEHAKTQANAVDYEDMILLTTAMIAEHPEVAAEVRDRYRHVTVDEFQDVNPAQWALLRAWLGGRDDCCVVGDDDQSIYGFTGADPAYLLAFHRHFPGARRFRLARNYRSSPQVLELANAVLGRRGAGRRLVADVLPGPAPVLREFAGEREEVAGVVTEIRRLVAEGVAPGQIAVCYRVNRQSEPFEGALADAGIPYVVRGEGGFFERPEIRQALRLLQAAAARPQDRGGPPPVGDSRPARAPRLDREVEKVLRDGLSFRARPEPTGQAARERWRNLCALLDLARAAAEQDPATTLAAFADHLVARAVAGHEAPGEDGAVTLLTFHRAKGLEFDAVLLTGVEEGLVPIGHAKDAAAVAEERRLLYVGVTRARRHLWISWARSRPTAAGTTSRRRPSRFLYPLRRGA